MRSLFHSSFLTDVKKLRDARVRRGVQGAITNVEEATSLDQIRSLKRLSGQSSYYRIRIGDWRIGLSVQADTVSFVRCLHRREIYRFFP